MAKTISSNYPTGITLTSTVSNPVTITSTGRLSANTSIGLSSALYGKGGGTNTWTVTNYGTVIGGGTNAHNAIKFGSGGNYITNGVVINKSGGLLTATNGYGVFAYGPLTVTNNSGATINAGEDGMFSTGGTLVNNGIIIGGNVGDYISGSGTGVVTNTGTITGGEGIRLQGVGTVTNAGTIIGTASQGAVYFQSGTGSSRLIADPGAVFNGEIHGFPSASDVIELASAASAGTLTGFNGTSITNFATLQFDAGAKWTVTGNASTAGLGTLAITGFTSNDTIDLTGFAATNATFASNALVLTNASTIHPTLHIQGSFSASQFQIASDGSGGTNITMPSKQPNPISGTYNTGITLTSDNITNPVSVTGTITVASGAALYGQSGASQTWTVNNSGLIRGSGTAGQGLLLGGSTSTVSNGVVNNASKGTIAGGASGISINGPGTVSSSGVISGVDAIDIASSASVTNMGGGTIAGSNFGVSLAGTGTVINQAGGTINGTTGDAIVVQGGNGTVVNTGIVNGQFDGVYEFGGGSVTNSAGGAISGQSGVVFHQAGTFTNAGSVTGSGLGAVLFNGTSAANRLIVDPGASFTGKVSGGTGVVELAVGNGSAGSLATFASTGITNFNTLQFDAGAKWTVIGNTSTSGLGSITITGFTANGLTANDTIDLTDFAATSGAFANNALVLTNASTIHPTLHIQGTFASNAFNIASYKSGGTDITLKPFLHNPIYGAYATGITLPNTLGSSISVTGTITPTSGNALYGPGYGANTWTIDNSGLISASDTSGVGIRLGGSSAVATGIVTNRSGGTIEGGHFGLYVYGNGSVINASGGTIRSQKFGVDIHGAGTVTNASNGTISGATIAVFVYGAGAQIYNAGTLIGANGVQEYGGGSVTNIASGTIDGSGKYGILLGGPGTVVNAGVVSGGTYAATVSGATYAAINLGEGGSIDNRAGATIAGYNGVYMGGINHISGGTVTNAGTVIANGSNASAVAFGTYGNNYRLIVDPGAVFKGRVVVNSGAGALELASGSSVGSLSNIGTSITNFTSLQFDNGSSWTISGDSTGLTAMSAITGLAAGDTIDLTGFQATGEAFAGGALTLTDSADVQAVLNFPDLSSISDFEFTLDGMGGTDIARAGSGRPLHWTATSGHDWNTAQNWSPQAVPTSIDKAIIANPGSNSVTIAAGASNAVASLTLGATSDTLEVDGTLSAAGTIAINAGTLAVGDTGTLSAAAITDNALLAFAGDQTLATPLSLGGTLAVQNAGTLTIGRAETITQTAPAATLDSTATGSESIVNQGTIEANISGGSLSIVPLNFTNQGTISAGNETLTIGFDNGVTLGSWSNKDGTISNAASLILDGSLATGDIGTITGATAITEAGLLNNSGTILPFGTQLGILTLASTGTVSGGTIVGQVNGVAFGGGTLSGVTYAGPLELVNPSDKLTVSNGLTVTGTGGSSPAINLTGAGASLDLAATQTLDGVLLNIGNASTADVLSADQGGTVTIGPDVDIESGPAPGGALATLTVSKGTTLDLKGTLSAIASGGTFTLANGGGTFSNDGTIEVGNGDTLDVNTAIVAGPGSGTIEVGTTGVVNVSSAVAADQTLAFTDASGLLRLSDPASFAATITGIQNSPTIDLTNFAAVGSNFANGLLTLTDASKTHVSLHIPGPFTTAEFHVALDGTGGTDITWTFIPQTFTWIDGSADWNTPSVWNLGTSPTSGDNAVIADTGTNTVTVGAADSFGINDLTVNGTHDTLAIGGTLSAGPVTIDTGSLVVSGSLAASQITNDALLAFVGSHTLDNTPLTLGGTLAVQNAGTLTLGPTETITQTTSAAVLNSTTVGGETIINQGTIDATAGGSLAIVPQNFANQGTINVNGETLTIGYDAGGKRGPWTNSGGTIALANGASLILDGSLATGGIGAITGAAGVTEQGLLNNTGAILDIGTGTELGTVTLASNGTISGGSIVDQGSGLASKGGTLSGVTYQGPLELVNPSDQLTITNGLTATGTGGSSPGTIDLTGAGASLDLAATQTIGGVLLNIGNASTADVLGVDQGGTVTIGSNVAIVSNGSGALATLLAGSGTVLRLDGTLNAIGKGGTFTLADSGGTLSNDGTIGVGTGDTLDVNTAIAPGSGSGTINVGTGGVVNVAFAVATNQTLAFSDKSGLLRLADPASFAATITGIQTGAAIDLTNFVAVGSSFANGVLTLTDASKAQVSLNIPGPFTTDEFHIALDGTGGTDITWTFVPQTFTWTDGSADWNTTSAWNLGAVPTSGDNAVIGDTGTNTVTVGAADSFGINDLTVNGVHDPLEVDGTLSAAGTITLKADTLAVGGTGTLSAAAITDNALLAFTGVQALDTPLSLAGTVQNTGTLIFSHGETITQTGSSATIDSTGPGSEIFNSGTIIANHAGGSLAIDPLSFTNFGTIDANGETLTIGYDNNGVRSSWNNNSGTISNAASLVLKGSVSTETMGKIIDSGAITEAGLIDNTGATLTVGNGTTLGAVSLISGGTVSGGTIVDNGNGVAFNGGTLDGVTYQGSLELLNRGDGVTITNGLTATVIDLTGAAATLDLAATQTLDNVTLNIGNAVAADVLSADRGGTVTLGHNASIVSLVGFATLLAEAGTTLDLAGTLSATSGVTITLADSGGTFSNDGTIAVNGGTVDVSTPLAALGSGGTIEVAKGGVVDVTKAVASDQTVAFADASGLLILSQPTSFAGTITGFESGSTIDLTNFVGTVTSFANNVLTLHDASNAQVHLHIQGPFNPNEFVTTTDSGGKGTDITWTSAPGTFTWIGGIGNWSTRSAWDLGSVPTGSDSAIIAQAGTNTITIDQPETIDTLTLNGANDTVAIGATGFLQARTIAINAGTLTDTGGFAAFQITDDGVLNIVTNGTQTLDNTPLSLGGTLLVSSAGLPATLTLGPSETITQDGANALISSNGNAKDTVINLGAIDAGFSGGSLTIAALNFLNQSTIDANGETLTIGYHSQGTLGSWSNSGGIIELRGNAALVLDGSLATGNIGLITGASGVTEIGLLDNAAATLNVGTGTPLGTVTLASSGVVSGGTIVDQAGGFVFSGGTLSDVTYQGSLELANRGAQAIISNGLIVTGTGGSLPGTIDLTGAGASLNFATTETLDNVTVNIGNSATADVLQASFNGGSLVIGPAATIVSADPGALATLTAGTGTTLDLLGTLNAIGTIGTFTLGDTGGTFINDGSIIVGNDDTLNATTAITAGSGNGTIDVETGGVADFAGAVAAGETLVFTDATGILGLHQPTRFAAKIDGFVNGDTINLAAIKANAAVWSPGTLTISNSGTTVAALSLLGDYSDDQFIVAADHAGGSFVTVTATCYAAGTRILTPRGEIAIEHLRGGDLVQTISGRSQPIVWIGHRRVDFRRHPNRDRVLPVRIDAHAFGRNRPRRELLLSPDHAVFVEDVLIPIRHLINGTTIAQITRQAITYYHIELPRHDVLLANGMPAESYLEAGARDAFANAGGTIQLHPDFSPSHDHYAMLWEELGFAPLVVTGAALERAREALARQAEQTHVAAPRYPRSPKSRGASSRRSAPAA